MIDPPVDQDLGCFAIQTGKEVAKVAAHQKLELSELSQQVLLFWEVNLYSKSWYGTQSDLTLCWIAIPTSKSIKH